MDRVSFERLTARFIHSTPYSPQRPLVSIIALLFTFNLFFFVGTTLYMHAISPTKVTLEWHTTRTVNVTQPAKNETEYPPNDTLIIYAYKETENAFLNAEFFLKRAIHDYADFMFVLNGEAPLLLPLIPKNKPNIRTLERENTCMDFGAYELGIFTQTIELGNTQNFRERYKKFILLNASIRGPFLPTWSDDCWSDAFTKKLNDQVKLAGLTFNCERGIGFPIHMQSMLIATDRIGLDILLGKGLIRCYDEWIDAVHAETKLSQTIIDAGYDINVMMTAWHGDAKYHDAENCDYLDPVHHTGSYFGHNIHPYETIFSKANRDDSTVLDHLTKWHNGMNYTSHDSCRPRLQLVLHEQ